ncbi:DNA-3-methyladenine glycosylase [Hathewaya histolytica]|uniref:DNA-(apurinic or apyrimidinic site) lyase n=1 Tax=Hathewaya histolytica TaxID=1498 RepID=A0A4U9RQS4_HATHI|nr:DNA-3-methyladenine glycosylase [Hathewaya histolytica]VTQ93901.1 8-oxoguanine DNA glycosylase [Hathewaya histolytica]
MDYREYEALEEIEQGIIIKNVKSFELKDIFDCGQCFRWNRRDDGSYVGVAFGKVIEVQKNQDDVIIYNTNIKDFYDIWEEYFDLKRNYGDIKEELSKDPILAESTSFGKGIRILKQDPFEITLSFIISANNRIPMIKKAINNISKAWGEEIIYKGESYYTFPKLEKLKDATIEELEECRTGFRAKYIKDTVEKIYSGEKNLDYIKGLSDDECHEAMKEFNGIGPKVSDCIILFSMQKYSAFPVDVWVKRAMQHFYVAPDVSLPKIRKFGRDKFGDLSGFAQQYLFYYARENNIKI